MNLTEAKNILWSMLTPEEKQKYIDDYKNATDNLSCGVTKTVISASVPTDAPAALYFSTATDGALVTPTPQMPNIVGEVFHLAESADSAEETLVVYESKDLVDIISLYFGNNVKV